MTIAALLLGLVLGYGLRAAQHRHRRRRRHAQLTLVLDGHRFIPTARKGSE